MTLNDDYTASKDMEFLKRVEMALSDFARRELADVGWPTQSANFKEYVSAIVSSPATVAVGVGQLLATDGLSNASTDMDIQTAVDAIGASMENFGEAQGGSF